MVIRIALIGASGSLGSQLARAFAADSAFECTIIARPSSHEKALSTWSPRGLTVLAPDYESEAALAQAFEGHAVVVDATASSTTIEQTRRFIAAAIKARVQVRIDTRRTSSSACSASSRTPISLRTLTCVWTSICSTCVAGHQAIAHVGRTSARYCASYELRRTKLSTRSTMWDSGLTMGSRPGPTRCSELTSAHDSRAA